VEENSHKKQKKQKILFFFEETIFWSGFAVRIYWWTFFFFKLTWIFDADRQKNSSRFLLLGLHRPQYAGTHPFNLCNDVSNKFWAIRICRVKRLFFFLSTLVGVICFQLLRANPDLWHWGRRGRQDIESWMKTPASLSSQEPLKPRTAVKTQTCIGLSWTWAC
jgi:hypothetical protein